MIVNRGHRIASGVLLLVLSLLHGDGTLRAADQTKDLIGAWRLVSFINHLRDGTTREDRRRVGYIVYTESGTMCATLVDPDRPRWANHVPTGSEAIAAITGMIAYCGTYKFNSSEGSVTHHVEIDRVPNAIGLDRKRWVSFDGPDRVRLRVDPSTEPGIASSVLVWERIQSEKR